MRITLTLLLILMYQFGAAQGHGVEYFESPNDTLRGLFFIDTQTYYHNSWQIGKPSKVFFTAAKSAPNAIITDTLNPYPINDTSVFIIKAPKTRLYMSYPVYYTPANISWLRFDYKSDIDTNEIVQIDVSGDSGLHWTNLIDSPKIASWGTKPDFKIKSSSWRTAQINTDVWGLPNFFKHDSVYIRFAFISDNVQTNKDGLVFDNFEFNYYWEGITELKRNNNLITVYPNPSNGDIYLKQAHTNSQEVNIYVYDMTGKQVYHTQHKNTHCLHLPITAGTYLLKYATKEAYDTEVIVITK